MGAETLSARPPGSFPNQPTNLRPSGTRLPRRLCLSPSRRSVQCDCAARYPAPFYAFSPRRDFPGVFRTKVGAPYIPGIAGGDGIPGMFRGKRQEEGRELTAS